jgi:hypothetical protein
MRLRLRYWLVLFPLLLFTSSPTEANIFGDAWNGIKGIASGAGQLIGAPFGGLLKGATDPMLDGVADRVQTVTNQAFDRLNATLATENAALQNIATNVLNQLNAQVNADLDRLDHIANNALQRAATLIDSTVLSQENFRQDLDQIRTIEGDAYQKVQAGLQDDIPFAASAVANEAVIAAVAIAFVTVLVGYAGFRLLRGYSPVAGTSIFTVLKSALRPLPAELMGVAVPMLVFAAVILGTYETYRTVSQHARANRLDEAAKVLEQVGDYRAAAVFRKRSFGISDHLRFERSDYWYRRDLLLGDFTQSHQIDTADLLNRIAVFRNYSRFEEKDADLLAASMYLVDTYQQKVPDNQLAEYKATFLTGSLTKHPPLLGKLVLVTEIRHVADQHGSSISDRINHLGPLLIHLVEMYPQYASGHILTAQFASLEADYKRDGNLEALTFPSTGAPDLNPTDEVRLATSVDPKLAVLMELANITFDKNLTNLIAAQAPGSAPSADLINQLNEYINEIVLPQARQIYSSDSLARLILQEKVRDAVVRVHLTSDLNAALNAARAAKSVDSNSGQFDKYLDAAQKAKDAGEYLVAESWGLQSSKVLTIAGNISQPKKDALDKLLTDLKSVELSHSVFQIL